MCDREEAKVMECRERVHMSERTSFSCSLPFPPSYSLLTHLWLCVTEIAHDIKQTQAREGEKDEGEEGMCAADCRTRTNRIPPRALHALP